MERMILQDELHPANYMKNPVFLDSSDLVDLATLKDKVKNTHNLLVLLTPGLLSRPWCLVEIVTALRHNVPLILVEIQRPGIKFQYPDEGFYKRMEEGEGLTASAFELLKKEGVETSDLVASIRKMFLKIAMPFSPHKSAAIR